MLIASVNIVPKATGWDFFDKGTSNKFYNTYTKPSKANIDFVEFIGIDSNNYYYLPTDMHGVYKFNSISTSTKLDKIDHIIGNSTRISGSSFFRNTGNLKKRALMPILKNWARNTGRLLFEDDYYGNLVMDTFNLEPDDKS